MTKSHIVQALSEYENERSFFNAGPFLWAIDCCNPSTKFYYSVKSFNQNELKTLNLHDPLTHGQTAKLKNILTKYENLAAGENSVNSSIPKLYTMLDGLLKSLDMNPKQDDYHCHRKPSSFKFN